MDTYNAKIAAGWILYYTDEGYPYYYHPETQESEWAEYDDEGDNNWKEINTSNDEIGAVYTEEEVNNSQIYNEDSTEEDSDEEVSDEGSDEDDSDDYGSSEEDEETVNGDEDNVLSKLSDDAFDRAMEAKFKAYLRTPAGQAAAEAELNRIGRRFEKRSNKRSRQQEKEYVRSLMERKKHDDIAAQQRHQQQSFFSNVMQLTTQWLYPEMPVKKNKTKKKFHESEIQSKNSRVDSVDQSSSHRGNHRRYDDFNRETNHRQNVSIKGSDSPSRSHAASLSSSETSETDSFSSEDSDVKQIDAPLFSEVSLPAWMSNFLGLSSTNECDESNEDVEEGMIERNNRDIISRVDPLAACRTMTNTVAHTARTFAQRNYSQIGSQMGTAAAVTSNIVQQGAYSAGCVFVQVFGVLFERLNPLLENFVETVVDYNLHTTAPSSNLIRDEPSPPRRLVDAKEASHQQSNRNVMDPEQPPAATDEILVNHEPALNHIKAPNLQNSPKPPSGPPPRQKAHVVIDHDNKRSDDMNAIKNESTESREEAQSTVSKVTLQSTEDDAHEIAMEPDNPDIETIGCQDVVNCSDDSNAVGNNDDVEGVVANVISDIMDKAIPSGAAEELHK